MQTELVYHPSHKITSECDMYLLTNPTLMI